MHMKQQINTHLPVKLCGIEMGVVERVEFLFKQAPHAYMPALKEATYKADGSGDVQLSSDGETLLIPWSAEETARFRPGAEFWVDAKIHRNDSPDNPICPMVPLHMAPTLFRGEDDGDG